MRVALLTLALLLTACGPRPVAPQPVVRTIDAGMLDAEFPAIAQRVAPGQISVGLYDLQSSQSWSWEGERMSPMQSVFKAPLAAVVLARVDEGALSLDETIEIREEDLSPGFSPVTQAWPRVRHYTVRDLIERSVAYSDNTAADVLMARIGGPGIVTGWLQEKAIEGIRIDRYGRDIAADMAGLPAMRTEWRGETFYAARSALSGAQRRAGQAAFLADPRDRMSPQGAMQFLSRLQRGELLSPSSTRILLASMARSPTGPNRLRAALPEGSILAHKTGTSGTNFGITPAVNDIGIVTLPNGRRYVIAVFVTGATQGEAAAETAIADTARLMIRALR